MHLCVCVFSSVCLSVYFQVCLSVYLLCVLGRGRGLPINRVKVQIKGCCEQALVNEVGSKT